MAEQYNSSHTGAIIDEKIQSLIDFGNIYEGKVKLGYNHEDNFVEGIALPGATNIMRYTEYFNWMRYSVIGNICFLTLHFKVNFSFLAPETIEGANNPYYAAFKGPPFVSLFDTGFSIYEFSGNYCNWDNADLLHQLTITIQGGKDFFRLENNNGLTAAKWRMGADTNIGISGFYFIQR